MTTLRWLLDVNAPNAAKTFDQIGVRMTELDRSLQKTREISIGDRDAMAKLARLQAQAERFKDRIHGMPLTIEGAAKAEAQLLTLEATADRLDEKLSGAGGKRGGIGGLFGAIPNPVGVGAVPPQAAAGGAIAALAALPAIAQVAAGAITIGLGGALTALGVIGAAKTKQVKQQFHVLSVSASADLAKISQSFVPVLGSIARTAGRVFGQMTGPLKSAMAVIAPAFRVFANSFIRAFGQPAMISAIQSVAKAFASILQALAPQLPGDIKDIAIGIERIANAVKKNPGVFAAIISFFFKATGFAFSMVAALTSAANYVEKHFIPALIDVRDAFRNMFHQVAALFDTWRHNWAHIWDVVYNNTIGAVIRLVRGINGWFHRLPDMILGALWGLGHRLGAFAAAALNEMWSGFKRIGSGIVGWIKNFAGGIVGVFKKIWGIFSPSSVFADIGKNMMLGLEKGIKAHAHKAQNAVSGSVKFKAGAGVQQWAGLVRQALAMEGLSPMLAGRVLYQMQTESGGRPNAINLWDSNAAAGDPSRGLMQVIGSTFAAYHWPGTSWNIYNPLANIAAAINYARHRYGPTLMSGGMGMGSGHGYASGTASAAPGWAWVGERGPELVRFRGGETVKPAATGAQTIVLEVRSGGAPVDAFIAEIIRRFVRINGGDVQRVLGRN